MFFSYAGAADRMFLNKNPKTLEAPALASFQEMGEDEEIDGSLLLWLWWKYPEL
jgi:hypothetical protein